MHDSVIISCFKQCLRRNDSITAAQALHDADAYGGSQLLLTAQQELLGKQMQSFERHMARLRDLMCVLMLLPHLHVLGIWVLPLAGPIT